MSRDDLAKFGTFVWGALKALRLDVFARLVYVVLVLTITLPGIFYALAAYQYQVDAAALAEERDVDVEELLARAAAWNSALHTLAALVEAGAESADKAEDPDHADEAATQGGASDKAAAGNGTADTVEAEGGDAGGTATGRNASGAQGGNGDAADARVPDETQARVLAAYREAVAALRARGPGAVAPPLADEEDEAAARVLASQLQRFDRMSPSPWLPFDIRPSLLAELPGWVLTLVVTLVAGLLGSLIFVLKAMLRQLLDSWSTSTTTPCEPRPWSWLLLRPVFGVVIAFGAYVALQSGLLVIDGAMSLSPSAYVTAAVGLIAGLLSWQVIDTIENVGEKWLASQRPLWGYGLKSHMPEEKASRAEIAKNLGVSVRVLEDWIAVHIPVPKPSADRLAAELKVCPDQLFQPVPPWRRRERPAST